MEEAMNPALPAVGVAAGGENEREAFEAVVRQNEKRLYRVLLGMVGDEDAARTLTQECLLKAYRGFGSFRGQASAGTWLMRIAVNAGRDHLRSRRWRFWQRLRFSDDETTAAAARNFADPAPSAERALIARETLAKVWRVASGLSPQQRAVFTLRFVEEMSLQEIAEAMDMKVATAKVHLFRAIRGVRRALEGEGQ